MTERHDTTQQPTTSANSALRYDPENFRSFVDDMGLSLSQQDALLEDIWLIVVGVIDAAFVARQLSNSRGLEKLLEPDSASVLRSIIISKQQKKRDA